MSTSMPVTTAAAYVLLSVSSTMVRLFLYCVCRVAGGLQVYEEGPQQPATRETRRAARTTHSAVKPNLHACNCPPTPPSTDPPSLVAPPSRKHMTRHEKGADTGLIETNHGFAVTVIHGDLDTPIIVDLACPAAIESLVTRLRNMPRTSGTLADGVSVPPISHLYELKGTGWWDR